MRYRITLEDLAANAMIWLLKDGVSSPTITYKQLDAYGAATITYLTMLGGSAYLDLSRDKTRNMLEQYAFYFKETEDETGLTLRDGISRKDLLCEFCGTLPVEILLAFMDQDVIRTLKQKEN